MAGETYTVVSIFPGKVFLRNIDATRAAVEQVIRLPSLRITPSLFEKAELEKTAAVAKSRVSISSRISHLLAWFRR
jgi:hypothetical protein